MTDSIIFKENNGTGIVILNKPKVLNALDYNMVNLFLKQIKQWKTDKKIKQVLIKG